MYKNGSLVFSWEDPPPLEAPDNPDLRFFPERITLSGAFNSPGGEYLKRAVYIPDISSFRKDEEFGGHARAYVSVCDPNGEVWLQVSLAGDWRKATKWFRGRRVNSVWGEARWDAFFDYARSRLPILPEERCVIISAAGEPMDYRGLK